MLRGERLGLDPVELGLGDRAAVEQLLRLGDLLGRATRACDRPDLGVHLRLRRLNLRESPLAHSAPLGDQVDEDAEVRQADHEDRPPCLAPAADVVSPKQIAEHDEQQPEEQDPGEEHEHRPHRLAKGVCEHRMLLGRLTVV